MRTTTNWAMRPSKLKHPVAVLRKILDLGQKELAEIVGCSVATIQSVELGPNRMKLSEHLAQQISQTTGVSFSWLISGNPHIPPLDHDGLPFTLQTYEAWCIKTQFNISDVKSTLFTHIFTWTVIADICAIILRAFEARRFNALQYHLSESVNELKKEFGFSESFKRTVAGEFEKQLAKEDFVKSGRVGVLDLQEVGKRFGEALGRIQLQVQYENPKDRRKMEAGLDEIRKLISSNPQFKDLNTLLEDSKRSPVDHYAAIWSYLIDNIGKERSFPKKGKPSHRKKKKDARP
jgi:transcriptional regulator with XRE-family HTH domain